MIPAARSMRQECHWRPSMRCRDSAAACPTSCRAAAVPSASPSETAADPGSGSATSALILWFHFLGYALCDLAAETALAVAQIEPRRRARHSGEFFAFAFHHLAPRSEIVTSVRSGSVLPPASTSDVVVRLRICAAIVGLVPVTSSAKVRESPLQAGMPPPLSMVYANTFSTCVPGVQLT